MNVLYFHTQMEMRVQRHYQLLQNRSALLTPSEESGIVIARHLIVIPQIVVFFTFSRQLLVSGRFERLVTYTL